MRKITFSVIIPLKKCNAYLEENISALLSGSFQEFEIIVLPDKKEKKIFPKTSIHPTGKVGPAEKRDIGVKLAKGEYVAFIDDDAYPSKDWLKHALVLFKKKKVAAVCGPGVTPPGDSVLQKASGAFSASFLGGGPYTYRFIPQKTRFVDDYPSMNFLVRKKDFLEIGGFDSKYWPGEDTKFCHDLVKKFNKKMLYDPKVLVYHHRRAIFIPHLIQNGRYGFYRGYFARILPKTSLRISYFIPSLLFIGILMLPVLYFFQRELFYIDSFILGFYVFLTVISSIINFIREKNIFVSFLLLPTIIITHIFYGIKFLQGFLITKSVKVSK